MPVHEMIFSFPTVDLVELARPRQIKIWWESLRCPETPEEMKAMHVIARKYDEYYGHLTKNF